MTEREGYNVQEEAVTIPEKGTNKFSREAVTKPMKRGNNAQEER